ncbi:DUF6906 family protein, partial [Escherichia sp. SP-MK2]
LNNHRLFFCFANPCTRKSYNLHPNNWLIFKKLSNELHLVHRHTNSIRVIPSAQGGGLDKHY